MNPANKIIELFGGVNSLAREINEYPATVLRWSYPRSKRGMDGMIPSRAQGKIISAAKRLNIRLTEKDLIKP